MLCNIGCPPETHLKLKSYKISFVHKDHNICFNNPILHRAQQWYCHSLCKIFQNDWKTQTDGMDERGFATFEFKMSFRRISCTAQHPRSPNSSPGSSVWEAYYINRSNKDPIAGHLFVSAYVLKACTGIGYMTVCKWSFGLKMIPMSMMSSNRMLIEDLNMIFHKLNAKRQIKHENLHRPCQDEGR